MFFLSNNELTLDDFLFGFLTVTTLRFALRFLRRRLIDLFELAIDLFGLELLGEFLNTLYALGNFDGSICCLNQSQFITI